MWKHRLTALHALWLVLAVELVVLVIVSTPDRLRELTQPLNAKATFTLQLTAADVPFLTQFGWSATTYGIYLLILELLFVAGFAGVAAVIFLRRADDPFAVFVSIVMLAYGLTGIDLIDAYVDTNPTWVWPTEITQSIGTAGTLLLFYQFPDGRFVPRTLKWVAAGWVFLVSAWLIFPDLPFNMIYGETWYRTPLFSFIVALVLFNTGTFAQFYRYLWVSTPGQREQTRWVVFGLCAMATAGIVRFLPAIVWPTINEPGWTRTAYMLIDPPLSLILVLGFPLSVLIAMLTYRLWNVDTLINRALVYGSFSLLVALLYVGVVTGINTVLQTQNSGLAALVGSAIVALLFHPLRERLQRMVNQLMFGDADDPVAVLSQLGSHLESAVVAEEILPTMVATVAQAFKSPYVAIEVGQGEAARQMATYGPPISTQLVRFPLIYQGEMIGRLLIAPRSGDDAFRSADIKLLQTVAHQAGSAVRAVQLTADLQRSRQQLVTTREEERRRLRRDLHDGLGPALAAHLLQIGSARARLEQRPDETEQLLRNLEGDIKTTLADLRRLVYGLRPPALDQLGLVGAIESFVHQLDPIQSRPLPRITVHTGGEPLPELPAAAEVAAYRIVQEAVTNVVAHAAATQAQVVVDIVTGNLHVQVIDNGQGLPQTFAAGVGLQSMKERADELGGWCTIQAHQTGGTTVQAWIPLMEKVT